MCCSLMYGHAHMLWPIHEGNRSISGCCQSKLGKIDPLSCATVFNSLQCMDSKTFLQVKLSLTEGRCYIGNRLSVQIDRVKMLLSKSPVWGFECTHAEKLRASRHIDPYGWYWRVSWMFLRRLQYVPCNELLVL